MNGSLWSSCSLRQKDPWVLAQSAEARRTGPLPLATVDPPRGDSGGSSRMMQVAIRAAKWYRRVALEAHMSNGMLTGKACGTRRSTLWRTSIGVVGTMFGVLLAAAPTMGSTALQ